MDKPRSVVPDGDGLIASDLSLAILAHVDGLIAPDLPLAVSSNRMGVVASDLLGAIVSYCHVLVMLDQLLQILLGLYVDLLVALCVLEPELIEPAPAGRRLALPPALRLVPRQPIGNLLQIRVHAPRDDRPIRVAPQKIHQHLLPHPGQVHPPEPCPTPRLAHMDPARALLVHGALAV